MISPIKNTTQTALMLDIIYLHAEFIPMFICSYATKNYGEIFFWNIIKISKKRNCVVIV